MTKKNGAWIFKFECVVFFVCSLSMLSTKIFTILENKV